MFVNNYDTAYAPCPVDIGHRDVGLETIAASEMSQNSKNTLKIDEALLGESFSVKRVGIVAASELNFSGNLEYSSNSAKKKNNTLANIYDFATINTTIHIYHYQRNKVVLEPLVNIELTSNELKCY